MASKDRLIGIADIKNTQSPGICDVCQVIDNVNGIDTAKWRKDTIQRFADFIDIPWVSWIGDIVESQTGSINNVSSLIYNFDRSRKVGGVNAAQKGWADGVADINDLKTALP